jgi:hypothetical protein
MPLGHCNPGQAQINYHYSTDVRAKFRGSVMWSEHVPGQPALWYVAPAQSPQIAVFITRTWSEKCFDTSHDGPELNVAAGVGHDAVLGCLAWMSPGISPWAQCHILIESVPEIT